jgi:hypothetical protein
VLAHHLVDPTHVDRPGSGRALNRDDDMMARDDLFDADINLAFSIGLCVSEELRLGHYRAGRCMCFDQLDQLLKLIRSLRHGEFSSPSPL